ncbi:MAG TPA: hypothetical protein VNX25_00585, partial [Verrucomicrobiae bacterium]|nr:hypothetical protein [Verrucomicrobiae bacterium]
RVGSYTFTDVRGPHSLAALFVTVGITGGVADPPLISTEAGNLLIEIRPKPQYRVKNVVVDGISLGAVNSVKIVNFASGGGNVSVELEAIPAGQSPVNAGGRAYRITLAAGNGGSIAGRAGAARAGETRAFRVIPKRGWRVDEVRLDGVQAQAGSDGSYALTVSRDHTLGATFARIMHRVATSCDPQGSISAPAEVADGGSATVRITPPPGRRVADVRVNGTSVGSRRTLVLKKVDGDRLVEAVFE